MTVDNCGTGELRGQLIFGMQENRPELPEGWSYVYRHQEWLLAQGPEGEHYYVTTCGIAYPRRFNIRDPYIDLDPNSAVDLSELRNSDTKM